ncbi:MAG: hypothetical protein IJC99_00315, partial [Clostridia bacterium]|nr:hypothetical protein [Clostridia bacterium]
MAGVRKRTDDGTAETPVEAAETQKTTPTKKSTAGTQGKTAVKKADSDFTTTKTTAVRKRTATESKEMPDAEPKTTAAKKSNAGSTKKSSTGTTAAKKTQTAGSAKGSGGSTAAEAKKKATGAAKTTTGGTQSTAKKTTAGAKKSTKTAPKTQPEVTPDSVTEEPTASASQQSSDALPALPLIDAESLVSAGSCEVGEAHPPVGFPEATVKRNFFARLGILLLLVAVLTASVFIYLHRPTSYVERTSAVNFLYTAAEDKTTVVVNGTVRGTLAGALQSSAHSARGDVYAAVVGNTLYIIRGKHILTVADNVQDYQLAAGGTALAYRVADSLYYRETGKKDTASLISKDCMRADYCLSADGKELVYTYQSAPDAAALMQIESFTDNKPYIESVAGLIPVAVSNKCKYIYYTKDGVLYIYNRKTEKSVVCSESPDRGSLVFNRDCTELLFTEKGGATVLFVRGERRQIVGAAAEDTLTLLPNRRVSMLPLGESMQYMASSFLNAYYLHLVGTGKQVARLDRKAKLTDLSFVDGEESITVTDKGVYFFLTDKSGTDTHTILYRIKPRKTNKERVAWDVSDYQTNVDGSRVLYTEQHNDKLYAWSASGDTKLLCDSVVQGTLAVTADDLFCFYRADGVLAVSDNGREIRDIATDVQGFLVDTHTVFYITT